VEFNRSSFLAVSVAKDQASDSSHGFLLKQALAPMQAVLGKMVKPSWFDFVAEILAYMDSPLHPGMPDAVKEIFTSRNEIFAFMGTRSKYMRAAVQDLAATVSKLTTTDYVDRKPGMCALGCAWTD